MSASALKAAATGQVQAKPQTIWDLLTDKRCAQAMGAVAGKYLTADRMLRLCINAVKKTPDLARCDPQSVLGAMMASAALGLEPNTIQQQAFLIPYERRVKKGTQWLTVLDCQFQIGARGYITLAYRSPHIKSLKAGAIHDRDLFEHLEGSQSFLKYAVNLRGRGDLIGAFSHVILDGGGETACVLPLDEIEKIRSKSETWRALVRKVDNAQDSQERAKAEQKLAETPWVMWLDDMATKSAIKKHAKALPIAAGDTMAVAAELDSQGDAGTLDLAALSDPDAMRAVVEDGAEAPALEHNPSEELPVSGEAFGTSQRQAVNAESQGTEEKRQEEPQPHRTQRRAAAPKPQAKTSADKFITRINDAQGRQDAAEVLAEAKGVGLTPAELVTVEEAFRTAWPDDGADA